MAGRQRRAARSRLWVRWAAAGTAASAALALGPAVERLESAGGTPSALVGLRSVASGAAEPPTFTVGQLSLSPTTSSVDAAPVTIGPAEGEELVTAPTVPNLPPEISPATTILPVAPPLSAAPSPTAWPTLVVPKSEDSRPHWEVTGQEALTRISFPWQSKLGGWTIQFLPGRTGLLGGTWTYEKRIEIYVRDYQDADEVAFTLAHELGHAVDVTMLTDADRETWRQTRRFSDPDAPWWVASGATDFSSGAGDWAESFAVWQTGGWSHSKLAGQPSNAQLAVVSRLAR